MSDQPPKQTHAEALAELAKQKASAPKTNAERVEAVADVLLEEMSVHIAERALGQEDFPKVQAEIHRVVPRVVASLVIARDALYAAVAPTPAAEPPAAVKPRKRRSKK